MPPMQYRGLELDDFQEQAIKHLQDGRSVLVSAPTGNGKTLVADWIVEKALEEGRRVVYTAPVKALSNQKYRDYTRLYGEDAVGLVTGDLVIRRDAPCRVMTTEILRNMLLSGEDLADLKAVILDEIHFLDDNERGTVWEEVLIYLPPTVQIVGLSATLSNLDTFAEWLTEVRGTPVEVVRAFERIVPLTIHYASKDAGILSPQEYEQFFRRKGRNLLDDGPGSRGRNRQGRGRPQRGRRPARRTRDVDLVRLAEKNDLLPSLYFVFSRRDTERFARGLSHYLPHSMLSPSESDKLEDKLREARVELGQTLDLEFQDMLRKGVAFHHAGLHVHLKTLVEELYEQHLIKVLYCTSTFALGINLPARSVIFDGIIKYDGTGLRPLPTRGFMQKAGRAGRRGLDDQGHVLVRVDVGDYEEIKPHLERYQRGAYEPVHSSFNLSWNSVVSLLERMSMERIKEVVERSFLSWHLTRTAAQKLDRAESIEEGRTSSKQAKEARRLRRQAAREDGQVWREFQTRVRFLQRVGYLDDDLGFNAGARVVRHLQMSEILVAELVLQGFWDELEPPTLFGVCCGIVAGLPRSATPNFRVTRDDRRVHGQVAAALGSQIVAAADELSGIETEWTPDYIAIGRAWANGKSFAEVQLMLASDTDLAGDLISAFRRAKDLVGQLREVYADVPDMADKLKKLVKAVGRDEVMVVG
ncbi:MAG: DEAD/DEAH box helicase [Deltaproteobacteria bacterium]|nr:MAG: DEAD/DEAH box helicase [Deltaproteobacteria bacterium]